MALEMLSQTKYKSWNVVIEKGCKLAASAVNGFLTALSDTLC